MFDIKLKSGTSFDIDMTVPVSVTADITVGYLTLFGETITATGDATVQITRADLLLSPNYVLVKIPAIANISKGYINLTGKSLSIKGNAKVRLARGILRLVPRFGKADVIIMVNSVPVTVATINLEGLSEQEVLSLVKSSLEVYSEIDSDSLQIDSIPPIL